MNVAALLLLKCLATVKAGKLPVWPLLAECHMESVCFFICQVKATVKAVPLGSGDGLVELGRDNYKQETILSLFHLWLLDVLVYLRLEG